MRKIALLLAAALVVSAPLIAAAPTLTYAAVKAKAKAAKGKEAPKVDPNSAFLMALSDLGNSLSQPWPAPDAGKKGKKAKGKK